MENIIKILPEQVSRIIPKGILKSAIELRLRVGQKLRIKCVDKEYTLDYDITKDNLQDVLKRVSTNSIYTIQNSINSGYVTAPGGNRIGITGEVVEENGVIRNIKNISSMNIRVAHEVLDCSASVIDKIYNSGDVLNTLIISPPGKGKTTMLRDIIRKLSNAGKNVGVVDERYEIANVYQGIPTMNLGERTDVMSGISKADGINFMVRSMGLDVIATDEIGGASDLQAVKVACLCGVKVIATAHGSESVPLPYDLQEMIDKKVFNLVIYLSDQIGKISNVLRV